MPAPPDAGGPPALALRAQAAWERRADSACLQQAIALWDVAERLQPQARTELALARAHYAAASAHLAVDQGALSAAEAAGLATPALPEGPLQAAAWHFARGLGLAERAVARLHADADPPELALALWWRAANLMQYAWARGVLTAYLLHPQLSAYLQASLDADPRTYFGMAHSLLATHLSRLPPELGGDLGAAAAHFAAARRLGPEFLATSVLLAHELLPRLQDRPAFVALLQSALAQNTATPAACRWEQHLEQRRAAVLLRHLPTLFY